MVMSVLARRETVSEGFNRAQAAGYRTLFAVPSAAALFHAYRESTLLSPDGVTLLIDVGYEASSVAIAGPGGLFFARNVNDGIFRLVKAVDGALGVGIERAEAFLRERVDLSWTPPADASTQHKNAQHAALSALAQLATTLTGTLRFAQTHLKLKSLEVDRVILSGGGALVPGVAQAIGRNTGKEPVIFRIGEHIPMGAGAAPGLAGPGMVVPVGLALAAADPDVIISLVPPEIAAKRDFWRRRVFHYVSPVAAAVVAAAAVIGANVKADAAGRSLLVLKQEVQAAETEMKKAQDAAEKLRASYALYDTLGRLAAPAALVQELVKVLHSNAPGDLKYTALYTEGSPASGTLKVTVEGVSLKTDDAVILEELAGLSRAIRGLGFVKDATSKTVEDKKREAAGRPFNIYITMQFAEPPAAAEARALP